MQFFFCFHFFMSLNAVCVFNVPTRALSENLPTSYDNMRGPLAVCFGNEKELFRAAECGFCLCVNALHETGVCVFV